MEGDMPAPVVLVVDVVEQEVYVTKPPRGAEAPEGLKVFPFDACLTILGLDEFFATPEILTALGQVLSGDQEAETYLLELLNVSGFFERYDSIIPMEPEEYFEHHRPKVLDGESLESAAERICAEALTERIVLDPLITELALEEALWQ